MIMIRNKNTHQCSGNFFNKTCAYMHLKAMNSLAENEIVNVRYYLIRPSKNENDRKIGPFDDFETLSQYRMIFQPENTIGLKTIVVL